jgi:hypothetical protein
MKSSEGWRRTPALALRSHIGRPRTGFCGREDGSVHWIGRAETGSLGPDWLAGRKPHSASKRSPRTRGVLAEAEAVALGEDRDRAEVDVELVAGDDCADGGLVTLGCGEEGRDFAEVVLEAGG